MNNHNKNGNAGYECDRNHGIARGNPAHTGCTTAPPTTEQPCEPGPGEHVDENGDCVKNGNHQCKPKDDEVLVDGQCVKKSDDQCVPGEGEMKNGDECVPVCPSDETIPMDDEDCTTPGGTTPGGGNEGGGNEGPVTPPVVAGEHGGVTPPETQPAVNRPSVVAGAQVFPPAAARRCRAVRRPVSFAGTPAGVLPMTGAGALMNTLAAAGLGLLVLGAAALLRGRTARG